MIAYVDTSVVLRAFLPDEYGHAEARSLIYDSDVVLVTGTWTRIEIAAAVARITRASRVSANDLLTAVLATLDEYGPVSVVTAPQDHIEAAAFDLAATHGLRALDAWHIACALQVLPLLAEDGEEHTFATRDAAQAAVAQAHGLLTI